MDHTVRIDTGGERFEEACLLIGKDLAWVRSQRLRDSMSRARQLSYVLLSGLWGRLPELRILIASFTDEEVVTSTDCPTCRFACGPTTTSRRNGAAARPAAGLGASRKLHGSERIEVMPREQEWLRAILVIRRSTFFADVHLAF
jgi:hypothetical protein